MAIVFVLVTALECQNVFPSLSNIFGTGKTPLQSPASLVTVASSISPCQSFSFPEHDSVSVQVERTEKFITLVRLNSGILGVVSLSLNPQIS